MNRALLGKSKKLPGRTYEFALFHCLGQRAREDQKIKFAIGFLTNVPTDVMNPDSKIDAANHLAHVYASQIDAEFPIEHNKVHNLKPASFLVPLSRIYIGKSI